MSCLTVTSVLVAIVAVTIYILPLFTDIAPPSDPVDVQLDRLPEQIRSWYDGGAIHRINGFDMFARVQGSGPETIILIHGFPTSSFDYHRAIGHLAKDFRVVMFDHLGFGFSDKPTEGFVYSLADHAENALALWQTLGIKKAHIVAHDMGDSVLTEILTRRQKNILPDYFKDFFQSITFTNGGMVYDLINQRLGQIALTTPGLEKIFSRLMLSLPESVTEQTSRRQLEGIWGPESDVNQRTADIDDMIVINKFKGGNRLTHRTIQYLKDRQRFERRWFASLKVLDLPCFLLWGDSDAVSPMEIPKTLAREYLPAGKVTAQKLQGTGHFLMLERPKDWATLVGNFVKKHG